MKDYIDIYLEDGSKCQMEVVSIFKLDDYEFNYIIYCELDRSHYYLAKYIGDNIVNLSTDFNDEEFRRANAIFKVVVEK